MSNRAFRFVQASDFHLEQPPLGLSEVPDHLRELFAESAYRAAQRVFDTVLAEEAEFLVLAGDILNPQYTGPRGPLFLVEQFARLAERGISVYWAGGEVDPPEAWPSTLALPGNVHFFPRGRVETFIHRRDGFPLVQISGVSFDPQRRLQTGDLGPDPAGLFSVAVMHGPPEPAALKAQSVHFWALGGRHDRSTLFSSPQVAHCSGSPQGRRPEEQGAHGCTLVEVDEQQQARTGLVPTDVLRWLPERVVVDAATSRDDLAAALRERMRGLIETVPGLTLLVSWTIAGGGPLVRQLQRGTLRAELLDGLRSEYGFGLPAAWSLAMAVEPSGALPPDWYEQETIRGDFLRAIRRFQMNAREPLDLEPYLCEEYQAGTLGGTMAVGDAARESVLREAALLGADLLSGEEPPP